MKSAGIALIAAIGIVAGILIYEARKPEPLRAPTQAEVKTQMDKLRADAVKRHPDMPQSDAMKEEAIRQGSAFCFSRRAARRAISIAITVSVATGRCGPWASVFPTGSSAIGRSLRSWSARISSAALACEIAPGSTSPRSSVTLRRSHRSRVSAGRAG